MAAGTSVSGPTACRSAARSAGSDAGVAASVTVLEGETSVILYTIASPEEVFDDGDRSPELVEVVVNGVSALAQPVGDGTGRIERVISTDPDHFLDPQLQPGELVQLL